MDLKQIQELVKIVHKSQISELTIEEDKFKITIKQNSPNSPGNLPALLPVAQAMPVLPAAHAPSPAEEKSKGSGSRAENLLTIKSPMIGTFYRSPAPDKPSFVNVGDEVDPGKVVCVIEAMKLFNEIESEVKGRIVKVLVEDASPVEYDQPLFLVEP